MVLHDIAIACKLISQISSNKRLHTTRTTVSGISLWESCQKRGIEYNTSKTRLANLWKKAVSALNKDPISWCPKPFPSFPLAMDHIDHITQSVLLPVLIFFGASVGIPPISIGSSVAPEETWHPQDLFHESELNIYEHIWKYVHVSPPSDCNTFQ